MDYRQKFDDDLRELFTERLRENEDFAVELWSALANVSWIHESDSENTEAGYSFRAAGRLISTILGHGDYLDWYCCGPDGVVSDYISKELAFKGWHFVLDTNELCLPPEAFLPKSRKLDR